MRSYGSTDVALNVTVLEDLDRTGEADTTMTTWLKYRIWFAVQTHHAFFSFFGFYFFSFSHLEYRSQDFVEILLEMDLLLFLMS